jgi:hypothetical protein
MEGRISPWAGGVWLFAALALNGVVPLVAFYRNVGNLRGGASAAR